MDRIIISAGIDRFVLLDEIRDVRADSISGFKLFDRTPAYLCIETLAQLGALHVRYLVEFEKHAFLLSVKRFSLPPLDISGGYQILGELEHRGSSAFSYRISATGEDGELEGQFLFAVAEYGGEFKRELMREHYRKVFSCLRNTSKTNC